MIITSVLIPCKHRNVYCDILGNVFDIKFNKKMPREYLGYLYIGKDPVHKLMGDAFFEIIDDNIARVIHHKDFNKLNNNLNNLCYITQSEHIKLHRPDPRA